MDVRACRRSSRLSVCALFMVVGALGCDEWLTKPTLYGEVDVTALRRNGEPVPGVDLILYTGPRTIGYATTDAAGKFRFEDVPQGGYGIRAVLPDGYEPLEFLTGGQRSDFFGGLTISPGLPISVTFTFLKRGPGSVFARVTDASGKPLPNVPAILYNYKKTVDSVRTDSGGLARFVNVPYGAYGVAIERPPVYRSYRQPDDSVYSVRDGVIVEADSRDSVRFSLAPCSAGIRFRVTDQRGDPVASAPVVLYTIQGIIQNALSDRDGNGSFPQVPCATPMGVRVDAPPGYTLQLGRGLHFFDGFIVRAGETASFSFILVKNS